MKLPLIHYLMSRYWRRMARVAIWEAHTWWFYFDPGYYRYWFGISKVRLLKAWKWEGRV